MNVDHRQVASSGSGRNPLEHELTCAGNVQQCQVLSRGAHENQVVILRIIQREEAPALHADFMMQLTEHMIQVIYGQHFADASVVIQDRLSGILRRIEVAKSRFWPSYESTVAEDDPRLFRSSGKSLPENP